MTQLWGLITEKVLGPIHPDRYLRGATQVVGAFVWIMDQGAVIFSCFGLALRSPES